MDAYAYFTSNAIKWEQVSMARWGSHDICHLLSQFQVMEITQLGLSAISHAEEWENPKRPMSNMAYLLLMPDQAVGEERKFGLVAVWTHPHQAHLPSLDGAVRKFALLINTGEDWAYAFMQLNEDSQHIPISAARHINAMIDSAPSRSICGCLSHLEVQKLLQCGGEVVYLEGLNGGLELLWVSLPKPLIWDSDPHTESAHEPMLLQVNLLRFTLRGVLSITLQWFSTPISSLCSVMQFPSDMVACFSMMTEREELLSSAMLDTSGQLPMGVSPRKPTSMVPDVPTASGEETPSEPGKINLASLKECLLPHRSHNKKAWPMTWPMQAAHLLHLSHQGPLRWLVSPVPHHHEPPPEPTPSPYPNMYCTFRKKWMMLWFAYSLPKPH